jgi:protein gp37
MIFVNSMSDLFQDAVPHEFIGAVWAQMAAAKQHTFQVLTKRAERMAEISETLPVLPNVWLGVSVENGEHAFRLEYLRRTAAAIRFVSFEPLLGSVAGADLTGIDWAIVGGESGPKARPMKQGWVREVRSICRSHGTAFFSSSGAAQTRRAPGGFSTGECGTSFPLNARQQMLRYRRRDGLR